jgi:hypothetical protein
MRFAIGVVLALSIGIGAYFGSAPMAGSANVPPRTVTLRIGDVAVLGQMQCVAVSESRSRPMRPGWYYMRCSKRPTNQARYVVDVFPDKAFVWQDRPSGELLYRTPH